MHISEEKKKNNKFVYWFISFVSVTVDAIYIISNSQTCFGKIVQTRVISSNTTHKQLCVPFFCFL